MDPNKYWWEGGSMAGPAPKTNPIRQTLGNFVEAIGNAIPGTKEGYLSEWIAGGPTKKTSISAYDTSGTGLPTLLVDNGTAGGGGGGGGGGADPGGGITYDNVQPQPNTITRDNLLQYFPGYSGWNLDSAWQDYLNTGGAGKGGTTGGGDPYAGLRNEISSGWDAYINSLNQRMGFVNEQKGIQEGMIGSQYNQGLNTLDLQKTQGLQDLNTQRQKVDTNQVKTLRDLTENTRNAFMAGNVYLGSRGAGDSSAASQYSYALTKASNKQRGDVMAQSADLKAEIDARETNLKNIYDSEVRNLASVRDQKLGEIAMWFSQAQDSLAQAQATGQLSKAQDLQSLSRQILDNAIAKANAIEEQTRNQYSQLQTWAMGISQNLSQLKTNMAGISSFAPQMPQLGALNAAPQVDSRGNLYVPNFYGSSDEDKNRLFGGR